MLAASLPGWAFAWDADEDARRTAELVHRLDAEQHREVKASEPATVSFGLLRLWRDAWLLSHEVGFSVGALIDVGAVTFDAEAEGEPPPGCVERGGGHVACTVVAAKGQSGHVGVAWNDRFARQGLLYTDAGWSGGVHYTHVTALPDEAMSSDDPDRRASAKFQMSSAGFSGVAYGKVGLTPKRYLPDAFITTYLGPALTLGTTGSPIGDLTYAMLAARSGLDLSIVPWRFSDLSLAFFFGADYQRPLAVRVVKGPEVTKFRPHQLSIGAGARLLIAL